MKWSLEEKVITIGLGVILLLLGLVNLMSLKNTTELAKNANQVQATYDTLGNLTDFYAVMTVAESGRRGYIFFGKTEELSRYESAVLEMRRQLNLFQADADLHDSQKQRIDRLYELANHRLEILQHSIALYQRDRSSNAMQIQHSITDRSVQLREQIQTILTEIKDAEKKELQNSLNRGRANIQLRSSIERIGIFLSFVIAGGIVILFFWLQERQQKLHILKQTLAQEQELSHLKLRLFSMISHEFRTPLSVILASSQLLTEILKPKIEQNQLKNLDRIQTSAKLMNRLITDILTLTRAEAGKLDHQPEWIDIEAFCLNLLDDIQSSNTTTHDLRFTSEGGCGRFCLDEQLLYSILSNLLLNAIKYSPTGSQVRLILHCTSEQVTFVVQDQGIGILPGDQTNIFTPFYRGQNIESIAGSGLGLAVVKRCLEIQNGRIQFESSRDAGTRFTVVIPGQCHNLLPATTQ